MEKLSPLLTQFSSLAQRLGLTTPDLIILIILIIVLIAIMFGRSQRIYQALGGTTLGLGIYIVFHDLFNPALWPTGGWLIGSNTGWIITGASVYIIFILAIAFFLKKPVEASLLIKHPVA